MKKYENTETIKFENYLCSVYGISKIGGRSENQDSMGALEIDRHTTMVTVCDGMGGAVGGATASQTAVSTIIESVSAYTEGCKGKDVVKKAGADANAAIYQKALDTPALRGMGTTTTIALFDNDGAYLGFAGDSRIYQIRENEKIFRTFDHSKVFELVKEDALTEEQARVHPHSNIITRVLGVFPEIDIETHRVGYRKQDKFILCCDGIWGTMPEDELIKMFVLDETPERVAKAIVDRVEQIGAENGNQHDNLTIIVVEMKENSKCRSIIDKIFS